MLGKHADGVIVGSALLERIENGDDPAVFLSGLQAG
jgi:tryptophan synthase alpha subunit